MSEKKRAYGVFLDKDGEETLIFSDAVSYAVYEREDWADTFKKEMVARWPNTLYKVKPMSMEVIEDE